MIVIISLSLYLFIFLSINIISNLIFLITGIQQPLINTTCLEYDLFISLQKWICQISIILNHRHILIFVSVFLHWFSCFFFRDFNLLNSSKNPRVQIIEIKSLSDKSPDDSDEMTGSKIKGTKATSILAVSPLKHTGTCFYMFFLI